MVKHSVADSIAEIAWFIESKGMVATAEKFADNVYDFFFKAIRFTKTVRTPAGIRNAPS